MEKIVLRKPRLLILSLFPKAILVIIPRQFAWKMNTWRNKKLYLAQNVLIMRIPCCFLLTTIHVYAIIQKLLGCKNELWKY